MEVKKKKITKSRTHSLIAEEQMEGDMNAEFFADSRQTGPPPHGRSCRKIMGLKVAAKAGNTAAERTFLIVSN